MDGDVAPRKRRPLVVGSGLLVFVCLFLPTLRVCGDPTAPIMFPPLYVVYVGSAIIAYFGLGPKLRPARIWMAGWFLLWGLAAVAVLSCMVAEITNGGFALVTAVFGAGGVAYLFKVVHGKRLAERGMFGIGVVQGLLVTAWYLFLVGDRQHMWGAYVGLTAGFIQTITSAMALSAAQASVREQQNATFPIARVVRN